MKSVALLSVGNDVNLCFGICRFPSSCHLWHRSPCQSHQRQEAKLSSLCRETSSLKSLAKLSACFAFQRSVLSMHAWTGPSHSTTLATQNPWNASSGVFCGLIPKSTIPGQGLISTWHSSVSDVLLNSRFQRRAKPFSLSAISKVIKEAGTIKRHGVGLLTLRPNSKFYLLLFTDLCASRCWVTEKPLRV